MTTDSRVVGAAAPLTFTDGTTYTLSPFTDRDIEELNEWLRSEYIRMVRDSLSEDVSEERYRLEMSLAHAHAATLQWVSGEGAKMMASPNGIARMVYQACLKKHPDIDFLALREKMYDPKNLDETNRVFERVNSAPKKMAVKKGPQGSRGKVKKTKNKKSRR